MKEFLESGDASEVSRCWRDLHVPFFSHQLVFAILLADFGTPAAHFKLFNLLGRLLDSGEISEVIVFLLHFMASLTSKLIICEHIFSFKHVSLDQCQPVFAHCMSMHP